MYRECEALYDEAVFGGLTPRLEKLQEISFAKWVESMNFPIKVSESIRMGTDF